MGYSWKSLNESCYCCSARVGKMAIKEGKIVVQNYSENWGTWVHIPGKAQMETLCCDCQPRVDKKVYKEGLSFQRALQNEKNRKE